VLFSASWRARGAAFTRDVPVEVVRINGLNYPHAGGDYHTFGVSLDGQRFLIFQRVLTSDTNANTISDADPIAGITVLMHWTQTVRK
jgi:hypothetical protein